MTKEKLRDWRNLKKEKDDLERRVKALEYGPGGLRLDGMPRSSKKSDPTVQQSIDHEKVLELYKQKIAEIDKALLEFEAAIKHLTSTERRLVRLYYADGLPWEEVCIEMSYSKRQIHRIHAKALERLKNV